MKSDPTRRDDTKYCEFHKRHGHRTDDFIQLKKEIESMIRRGHLNRYVALEGRERVQLEHLVCIGSMLAEDIRSSLIHFLEQNMEVFA